MMIFLTDNWFYILMISIVIFFISLISLVYYIASNTSFKNYQEMDGVVIEKEFEPQECGMELDMNGDLSYECEGPFFTTVVEHDEGNTSTDSERYYKSVKNGDKVKVYKREKYFKDKFQSYQYSLTPYK